MTDDLIETLCDYNCKFCHFKIDSLEQSIEYDNTENVFFIIRINNIFNGKFVYTKILNFNPDIITVPGICINNKYICKAAIIFHPFDDNFPYKGGHYVCLQRSDSGWINVSDDRGYIQKNFFEYLSGVYLLFLAKIS